MNKYEILSINYEDQDFILVFIDEQLYKDNSVDYDGIFRLQNTFQERATIQKLIGKVILLWKAEADPPGHLLLIIYLQKNY